MLSKGEKSKHFFALAKTEEAEAGEELDCGVGKEKEPKIPSVVCFMVPVVLVLFE